MDSTQKTLEAVQRVLQPYVRPRDEVAHIRRILILHLSSGLKDGATLTEPLSLTESSELPSYYPQEIRGPYRDFLEALSANIKARKEYQTLSHKHSHPEVPALETTETQPSYLLRHLASLKIRKKQGKLLVIEKNLDLLRQKPAASSDFLDHQRLFRNCRPLPEVPTEVANSLALEQTSENSTASNSVQLKSLIDTLEHRTFRTKLSLKQEEDLLEKAKNHLSAIQPKGISTQAKIQALNASRTELIDWIETELGKASAGDGRDGGSPAGKDALQAKRDQDLAEKTNLLSQKLASIKDKYTKYLAERTALLELITTQLHSLPPSFNFPAITTSSFPPTAVSPERPSTHATAETPTPANPVIDHLLTPTLTSLLRLSHEHKGLLAHKAHIATLLSKQVKENAQVLDHLAEESQLLPAHAMAAAAQKKDHNDSSMTSDMVRPWVSAADAAKISTLEVVAEKIEEGQMALEGSIRLLEAADRLLGRGLQQQSVRMAGGEEEDDDQVGDESDIWLVEGQKSLEGVKSTGGAGLGTNRDEGGRKGEGTTGYRGRGSPSIWDLLDVDVGLEKSG
ncbi:hypothetical protein QBC32DRAFT_348332 [Pseudoneurospora amorphoporcata]|uniref:Uncharacterized protein n=1 Tax=Pseudoneurospora amorphoporcata TaxID=241081 RepID=A0AAN6NT68_9PEZI|nr:hypothetical protein QBC32DRAFT_348332 [Pseudoneurospora amorphoporcata]